MDGILYLSLFILPGVLDPIWQAIYPFVLCIPKGYCVLYRICVFTSELCAIGYVPSSLRCRNNSHFPNSSLVHLHFQIMKLPMLLTIPSSKISCQIHFLSTWGPFTVIDPLFGYCESVCLVTSSRILFTQKRNSTNFTHSSKSYQAIRRIFHYELQNES